MNEALLAEAIGSGGKGHGWKHLPDDMQCIECGETIDFGTGVWKTLLTDQHCFTCWHWLRELDNKTKRVVIVDGVYYSIGKETKDRAEFRGHGGRRFHIRYHDRTKEDDVTTNLWCGGDIPERFSHLFPNNAEFLPATRVGDKKMALKMAKPVQRWTGYQSPPSKQEIEQGMCPTCHKQIGTFTDRRSEKEYEISGMCQSCQDSVFGAPAGVEA